jgi:hypothetical protein
MSGIREKKITRGKQFDEHAKRYFFYPLSNLNLTGSQAQNPLWEPKIAKGRITLLESVDYHTQVVDEGEHNMGFNGVSLGIRTMGTDAQINYLMGNSDGTGFMAKGGVFVEALTAVDAVTAQEVEYLIYGVNSEEELVVPAKLRGFEILLNRKIEGDDQISDLARQVQYQLMEGVKRSQNWVLDTCLELEKELREGQAGRAGIKSLSKLQQYYFEQIERPLPEDRAGTNMGNELAKVLAPVLAQAGVAVTPSNAPNMESDMEMAVLRKQLEAAQATIKEQEDVITELGEKEAE